MIQRGREQIDDFLTRGVENIFPSKEFVKKRLLSGEKLRVYLGIDPTGPTLHLGHAVQLKKMKELQELGHEVIILIGDFTAQIGDPTDKTAARKPLTHHEVLANARLYKEQASVFLKFGFGGAKIKYNSVWLSRMHFADVVKLASKMTVDQMLKRDMFEKRREEGKPTHIHEFLYPLMQGYDSVALAVDGEIGGNDQTFNMLAGRDLEKEMLGKDKFVLTTKLLEDSSGKKMGKTDNNAVSMLHDEFEMFGKVMSWTDGMIIRAFEICTFVPMQEVAQIEKDLAAGANPRDAKARLAREIVTIYHGAKKAAKAEENFFNTFKRGGVPENTEEVRVHAGASLAETLLSARIVESKSEFRRLILEGAVSDAISGEKITDPNYKIEKEITLRVGKKRFVHIIL